MKMKKTIYLFVFVIFATTVLSFGNSRLGDSILDLEEVNPQIIELTECYSSLNKAEQISFNDYYNNFKESGLDEECQSKLSELGAKETWYEEKQDSKEDDDEDFFTNLEEIEAGTDPNNEDDFPWWIDVDGDGSTNNYELFKGSDPLDVLITPTWKDTDHDGFSDSFELEQNTNPENSEDYPNDLQETTASEESNLLLYLIIIGGLLLLIIFAVALFVYHNKKSEEI